MIKSNPANALQLLLALIVLSFVVSGYTLGPTMGEKEWLDWSNKVFSESFNPLENNLKKWEFTVTPEHFIRLRKFYLHGKQEYYSFHINKLDSISYNQTVGGYMLKFKTSADDVIVQTYEDPKGNIDSMSTELIIPVKAISQERLDSLNAGLKFLKKEK